MTPLAFVSLLLAVSIVAGTLGAVLGIGGGMLLIPVLTLWLGLDIRYAVGASVVSIIATSSGAAATYVRDGLTNLRVAMVLEIATSAGALAGACLAGVIHGRWLYLIFALVVGYSAIAMLRKAEGTGGPVPPDGLADRLGLHGTYFDAGRKTTVPYRVTGVRAGLALMLLAGLVSGLLGIGSGSLKVTAMDLAMHLPIKVSSATSNFMIGVTAAASAGVYFARGDMVPLIAGPVAFGVLLGSLLGSALLPRMENAVLRRLFVAVLLWVALQMLQKGLAWS